MLIETGMIRKPGWFEMTWAHRVKGRPDLTGARRWYWRIPPLALNLRNGGLEDGWQLHIGLVFAQIFLWLPLPRREPKPSMRRGWGDDPEWGFTTSAYGLHLRWGDWSSVKRWPWSWEHLRTEWRCVDGSWWVEAKGKEWWAERQAKRASGDLERHVLPYRYVLRSGRVQEVEATIHVERMTWFRRWLPFWRKTRTSIDIEFSDEVGERAGSWKGGTTGSGYAMRPGESAPDCLARMERERVFD